MKILSITFEIAEKGNFIKVELPLEVYYKILIDNSIKNKRHIIDLYLQGYVNAKTQR